MAKTKKRKYTRRQKPSEIEELKIEKGVPMPVKGKDPVLRAKLLKLLGTMGVSESFIVRTNKVSTVHRLAKTEFKNLVMRSRKIPNNPTYSRVWRAY